MPLPRDMRFGRIVADGINYQISHEDVAWLTCSVNGEDSQNPEFPCWSMIQRFVGFEQNRPGMFRTLRRLVMLFSQVLNPSWAYPDDRQRALSLGGLANVWQRANTLWRAGDDHCSPARLQRRRQAIARPLAIIRGEEQAWNENYSNVREAVVTICQGRSGNPVPRWTNFASNPADRRAADRGYRVIGGNRVTAQWFGGNVYYRDNPPIRGGRVDIIGSEGQSSRTARVQSFPGGGQTRASARRRETDDLGSAAPDLGGGEPGGREEFGSSGEASVAVPSRPTIAGAGPLTLDHYVVAENIDELLETWARGTEEELTRFRP